MTVNKIFGLGLSKTATTSLASALKILKYRTNDYPSLKYFPHKLYGIKKHLLDEYDAFTDISVIPFYKELDKSYPGSKFILTIRDIDEWLESCSKYPRFNWPLHKVPFKVIKLRQTIYRTVKFDEELFREAYHRHHKDVLDYFKNREDDLLVVNLCEGNQWEPLVDFLDTDHPEDEFPIKNARVNNYDGYFVR
ncbi:hypothetical protein OKW21_002708 [Catalinimonas alkaloidigena]|uniref:sulfotransferase family protein n=1 Tax=Catalinimonas alkaloidigena TaxID=1075417 RepID=UPI0024065DCC|nr:sulfotransferase family protein [Catalinimonas alkaloidigena]MDF9797445.1 hypothetical protein [Catalinimonas alkaloidigena]